MIKNSKPILCVCSVTEEFVRNFKTTLILVNKDLKSATCTKFLQTLQIFLRTSMFVHMGFCDLLKIISSNSQNNSEEKLECDNAFILHNLYLYINS